ncbi:hypothetical protein JTB14_023136 [Gonioctena quinquepunctata]|nr:hypothetical protein JTB14_023136 [Gonioctena quinquepunctata]
MDTSSDTSSNSSHHKIDQVLQDLKFAVPQGGYKQPAAAGYVPQQQYVRQPPSPPVYESRGREGLQNYATNGQLLTTAVDRQVPKVAQPSASYYLNQIQSAQLASQAQEAFTTAQRTAPAQTVYKQYQPALVQQPSIQYSREPPVQYSREQPQQYVREQPQVRYISRPVAAQYRVQQQEQPRQEEQKEKEDYDSKFPGAIHSACLPESARGANPSGWINAGYFSDFSNYFVKYTRCSKDIPVLLLLDNQESHVSIAALYFLKDNGVTVLSFPPYCSYKLNRSVYGPQKDMSFHQTALPLAATPYNNIAGFKVPEIFPFNEDIFQDHELSAGYATDRPQPSDIITNDDDQHNENHLSPSQEKDDHAIAGPSTSTPQIDTATGNLQAPAATKQDKTPPFTPLQMKLLPKAEQSENSRRRKKRGTAVLTHTPVKDVLMEEQIHSKNKNQ